MPGLCGTASRSEFLIPLLGGAGSLMLDASLIAMHFITRSAGGVGN